MFSAHARGQATRTQRPPDAQAAISGARWSRCSNLDFGRSWRRTLVHAGHVRVIASGKDACQPKRHDETRCLHSVAEELHRAHRHEEAIPAAVGNGRFLRATRHVFRHRHRRIIDHRLIRGGARVHGGGHGHGWLRDRAKKKPDDCWDGQQSAYDGLGLHSLNIALWLAAAKLGNKKPGHCLRDQRFREQRRAVAFGGAPGDASLQAA
jgi:hypothetical protein